jgi:hypothetical protein
LQEGGSLNFLKPANIKEETSFSWWIETFRDPVREHRI